MKYAAYTLSVNPTRANRRSASPIEVLTNKAPDPREVAVFGSTCAVNIDPRKNLLAQRSQVGVIIEFSYETNAYSVFRREGQQGRDDETRYENLDA